MTWAASATADTHAETINALCTTISNSEIELPPECINVEKLELETAQNHIFFETNVTLTETAVQQLDLLKLVMKTKAMANTCYRLVGHSDTSGDAGVNLVISRQRAEVVAKYLQDEPNGVEAKIEFVGLGEAEPMVGLSSDDKKNRRVAIFAKHCP